MSSLLSAAAPSTSLPQKEVAFMQGAFWCYFQGIVCRQPQIAGLDYFPSWVRIGCLRTYHAISLVTSSTYCCCKACLEIFRVLIELSRGSALTQNLFTLWQQTASSAVNAEAKNRKMLFLKAFQHALLLLCAETCSPGRRRFSARGRSKGRSRLKGLRRAVLCPLWQELWMTQLCTKNSF